MVAGEFEESLGCKAGSYCDFIVNYQARCCWHLFNFLQAFGLSSKNPVLKNITDYLIEEASAEEEELLGMSGDHEEGQLGGDGDGPVERDPALIKVGCHF